MIYLFNLTKDFPAFFSLRLFLYATYDLPPCLFLCPFLSLSQCISICVTVFSQSLFVTLSPFSHSLSRPLCLSIYFSVIFFLSLLFALSNAFSPSLTRSLYVVHLISLPLTIFLSDPIAHCLSFSLMSLFLPPLFSFALSLTMSHLVSLTVSISVFPFSFCLYNLYNKDDCIPFFF